MGTAAVVHMQDIVVLIECWEPWSNIYLNRDKSFISAIDYSQRTQVNVNILYRGRPLPQHPVDEPFRYLGVLVTLTLNFKFEKERVMRETKLRLEALLKAQSLSSSMREAAVKLGIVSVFRYSAGLVLDTHRT